MASSATYCRNLTICRSKLKSGACSKIEHDGATVCCLPRVGGTGGAPGRFMVIVFSPPTLPTTRNVMHTLSAVINIVLEGDFLRCPVSADCISSWRRSALSKHGAVFISADWRPSSQYYTSLHQYCIKPHSAYRSDFTDNERKVWFKTFFSSPHHHNLRQNSDRKHRSPPLFFFSALSLWKKFIGSYKLKSVPRFFSVAPQCFEL